MSQHSPSRKAFLNNEHAKVTGNLPDVPTNRDNAHRKSWELREASTLNIEASHPLALKATKPLDSDLLHPVSELPRAWVFRESNDSYEPHRLGSQS